MKANFRSSQLSLPIAIAPAADPPARTTLRDDLPEQLARLTEAERTLLRLKALVGVATNKSDFLTMANASVIAALGGVSLTYNMVNPMLNRLLSLGLLNADFACVESLRHPLAIEMIAAPEGGKAAEAVRRIFPAASNRSVYYSYSPQSDPGARVRLRLAIYENDGDAFRLAIAAYDKAYSAAMGPHILEDLFADTILDVSWLASRDLDIQFRLFWVKLGRLLSTGLATADMPALLAHYRDREDTPGHAEFKWALLRVDILAGKLVAARRKILSMPEASPETAPSNRHLLLGSVNFLEGRNDEALVEYRQALKLYTKEIGKRKVFFEGSNGLFFLLALIRANNSTLHAEIQKHLDAIDHEGNPFSAGFQAILALLHLLRGAEPRARALLDHLRQIAVHEPVSAACVALVEFLIDPALAKARIKDNEARFAALAGALPLVARVHAEILAKISSRPGPYEDFLRDAPDGGPLIAFTELVALQQPWERGLESLANFLGAGATAPAAAPAAQKSRRLVWFVDPELKLIEAVEQSAKGANGWTSGRNVAMKRLHEQDPRLDYLSDHDRRALRTTRKTSVGWYGQENYDFDPYATLLALVDHPLVYDYRRRDQRLELVSYPVELVVSEQANGYRFTLSHRAAEPTVFLEAETPTRWRVVDFASRLLALQEILGAGGLIVPRQGRERVMALVRVQHPSLPIRADIAEADLPAISGRPEPVLQIQPLEEGLKVTMVTRPFGPAGPFYLVGLGGKSVLATIDGARQRANRDLDAERALAGALLADLTILEGRGIGRPRVDDRGRRLGFGILAAAAPASAADRGGMAGRQTPERPRRGLRRQPLPQDCSRPRLVPDGRRGERRRRARPRHARLAVAARSSAGPVRAPRRRQLSGPDRAVSEAVGATERHIGGSRQGAADADPRRRRGAGPCRGRRPDQGRQGMEGLCRTPERRRATPARAPVDAAGGIARLPARGVSLAVAPGALASRGLSRRRHGTGQDRSSHRGHARTGASRPLPGHRADVGLSQLGKRTDPFRPQPRDPTARRGGRKG